MLNKYHNCNNAFTLVAKKIDREGDNQSKKKREDHCVLFKRFQTKSLSLLFQIPQLTEPL